MDYKNLLIKFIADQVVMNNNNNKKKNLMRIIKIKDVRL